MLASRGIQLSRGGEQGPAVVEGDDAAEHRHGLVVRHVAAADDRQRVLADDDTAHARGGVACWARRSAGSG
jgi:hypothetical protein